MTRTTALLPTGRRYNPREREGYYADPAQVAYVLVGLTGPPERRVRVATSYGSVGWPVGHRVEAHHDQTLRSLGSLRVVGISHPDGRIEGEVPDRKLAHWVFK